MNRKVLVCFAIFVGIFVLNNNLIFAEESKIIGDINNNLINDYNDLELITEYLRGSISLSDEQILLADTNNDGKIDEKDRKQIVNLINKNYISKKFSEKEWIFENMPNQNIYEYDGLEIMPTAYATDKQAFIKTISGRYYNDNYYTKALHISETSSKFKKSVKITISEPSILTFYAYEDSSAGKEKYAVIADRSNIVEKFDLAKSDSGNTLKKCEKYLSKEGEYYIYCTGGSMCVCCIQLQKILKGDLNADGKITFADYNLLYNYLIDKENNLLNDWQNISADIDLNGEINNVDLGELLKNIKNNTDYYKYCYSEKVWNFTDIKKTYFQNIDTITEKITVDGLTLYPARIKNEEMPCFDISYKDNFEYGYNTAGYGEFYSRCIAFDINAPCAVKIYYRSGSTNDVEQSICLVSEDRKVEKTYILNSLDQPSEGTEYAQMLLDRPGEYHLYAPVGSVRFFAIELHRNFSTTDTIYDITRNVSSENGKTLEFILSGENLDSVKDSVFRLDYDYNFLSLEEIGISSVKFKINLKNEEIEILEEKAGMIIFKINDDLPNWTGALTVVKFKGKQTGSSDINFSILRENL